MIYLKRIDNDGANYHYLSLLLMIKIWGDGNMNNGDFLVKLNDIMVKDYSFIPLDSESYVASYYDSNYNSDYKFGNLWTKLIFNDEGKYVEYFSGLQVEILDLKKDIDYLGESVCDICNSEDVFSKFNSFLFINASQVIPYQSYFDCRLLKSEESSKMIRNIMYKKLYFGRKRFSNIVYENKSYNKMKVKKVK